MNRHRLLWITLAAICMIVAAVVNLRSREDESAPPSPVPSTAPEQNRAKRARIALRALEESTVPVPSQTRPRPPELEALYQLAERDLPAALAEAKRIYAGRNWQDVQAALAGDVLAKDFSRAAEICALLKERSLDSCLEKSVPSAFRRDRAATTAVVFDQLTGKTQDIAASHIIRTQLEDGDLLAAMQTHLRMPNSFCAMQSAHEIGRKMKSRDLDAGLRWFAQLQSDDLRKGAHSRMVDSLQEAGDVEGLVQLLAVTPPEEELRPGGDQRWNRSALISSIARLRRMAQDTQGLQALHAMLSDEEKDFVDVGILYAEKDKPLPELFVRATELTNREARQRAIHSAIGGEVSKDPHKAAEFVLGLDDTHFRTALSYLVRSWKHRDKTALADWVRALPAGDRRESAIEAFVMAHQHGRGSEKELAREFAALAADPAHRDKLLREIPSILSDKERAAGIR